MDDTRRLQVVLTEATENVARLSIEVATSSSGAGPAIDEGADREGRQIQALVDEALADLIEKRKQGRPRAHVMSSYQASHETFAPLYQKLAE